jgi:hypothetical protein
MNVANLTVWLGADITDLERKLGAAKKQMEAYSKTLDRWGKRATIVGGAVTASVGVMVRNTMNAGDEFAKMSVRTGVAVEELSAMSHAADLGGVSMRRLERGLFNASRALIGAEDETGKKTEALKRLGIASHDASGNIRTGMDVMLDASDALREITSSAERATLAAELFGQRSGPELLPLLMQGREAIEEQMRSAESLGKVFSTSLAEASEAVNDQMTTMKAALAGVAVTITETLIPYIQEAVEVATEWVKIIGVFVKQNPGLIKGIVGAAAALAVLGPAMVAVGIAMSFVAANPIIVLLTGIGIAVGVLITYFGSWEAELRNLKIAMHGIIGIFKVLWTVVKTVISQIIIGFSAIAQALWKLMKGDFRGAWDALEAGGSAAAQNLIDGAKDIADAYKTASRDIVATWTGAMDTVVDKAEDAAKRVAEAVPRTAQMTVSGMIDPADAGGLAGWSAGNKSEEQDAARQALIEQIGSLNTMEESTRRLNELTEERTLGLQQEQALIDGIGNLVANQLGGAFADVAMGIESMGAAINRVMKQLIRDLIAAAARALILRAITGSFTGGGFFGSIAQGFGINVPKLASGGIVTKPTLAVVGEAGPEAVVPLSRGGYGGAQNITTVVQVDGREIARAAGQYMPEVVGRYGARR